MGVAWLEWNGVLYWAEHQRVPFEPRSALTSLVEGIWSLFPDSAHFMLRSRIYTQEPLTELCRGTVIVCAKRTTQSHCIPEEVMQRMRCGFRAQKVWPFPTTFRAGDLSMAQTDRPVVRAEMNRSVECWLISSQGRLLATSFNSAGRNRTQHAEMNLIRQWWQREKRPLPRGGRLIVTLEPCAMCAGAIWECVADRSDFKVTFISPDRGTASARSVLRGHPMLCHCPNLGHPEFF